MNRDLLKYLFAAFLFFNVLAWIARRFGKQNRGFFGQYQNRWEEGFFSLSMSCLWMAVFVFLVRSVTFLWGNA